MLEQFKKDRVAQLLTAVTAIFACLICGMFGYMGFRLTQRDTAISVPEPPPSPQVQQAPTSPPVIQIPLTATPEPALIQEPALTVDVKVYGVELVDKVTRLNDALDNLEALLKDAQVNDNGWLGNLAIQTTVIQAIHREIEGMNPPPQMAHVHGLFLDSTKDCYDSMGYLTEGIDQGDLDAVDKASDLLASCNDKTYNALKVLKDTTGEN